MHWEAFSRSLSSMEMLHLIRNLPEFLKATPSPTAARLAAVKAIV
jgi:hypothetical protein